MVYTALYREWRPKNFNEVVGQKQVTITLKNQIKSERIAHAYLLCGTRGTGKTSTAKILAKAVNCLNSQDGEPCNQCEMCKKINSGTAIDVTELDAASHNGVDDIRNIIDDVQYPSHEAKYKVYIIDEVHMLSMGAVNAFLKTLEEPPKNVIFILATTDPQKLPITILSRCQRFDFKRIKKDDISKLLRAIVDKQGVFADDKSLNLVARIADGAMRDALSILDQAISTGGGRVEYDNLVNLLGLVTNEYLIKITESIINKNVEAAIRTLEEVVFNGKDINIFIKDLITHMRNLMMAKVSNNPEDVLDMSLDNIEIIKVQASEIRIEEIMRCIRILQETEEQSKWSKQSRIYLELAIIKMCKIEYDTSNEVILARINKLEKVIKEGKIQVEIAPKEKNEIKIKKQEIKQNKEIKNINETEEDINSESELTVEHVKKAWRDILEIIKARRMMVIYAYISPGELISCEHGIIMIKFAKDYFFSKVNLEKGENSIKVNDIFSEVLKDRVKVKYQVESEEQKITKSPEEVLKEAFGEELVDVLDE